MSGPSVILKLDPAALPTGSIVPNTNAAYKNVFDNAEIGKPIIMTEHPECMKPGPLDLLSQATYAEIESLLKTNELGVQRFFNAKGCSEIADALVQQRVTGTNLSMLTAANIDSDLRLDLGQRLALKNFLHRVKVVAHGKARNDTVWESESFDRREEKLRMEGMLPKSVVGLFETCTLGSNKKKKKRDYCCQKHIIHSHTPASKWSHQNGQMVIQQIWSVTQWTSFHSLKSRPPLIILICYRFRMSTISKYLRRGGKPSMVAWVCALAKNIMSSQNLLRL